MDVNVWQGVLSYMAVPFCSSMSGTFGDHTKSFLIIYISILVQEYGLWELVVIDGMVDPFSELKGIKLITSVRDLLFSLT